ncbi:MAG: hypothetical protein IJQ74_04035 [Synergistaceae bacterium]|nr:hypothetical protein [Synergistaceae bacterium]MBQ3764750.1 hypothetical protein [Synergistaceae bacterium]MBQ6113421.1 hypothetical protein [Synergistaceae bacterium]MBQ6919475.1 hypothetical protein [Synergistaceae bacterium]MBQ6969992.1 hypothetical protein [Synergistaceae bacterium]
MTNKITVSKANDMITFYLHSGGKRFFLFVQKYSKGVYDFFAGGRSESEIRNFKMWNKNPRLDKTITKIPLYLKYVFRYEA